jgi:hypothetical protein
LSGSAAGLHPQRRGVPYLVARQNDTAGNWNSTGNLTVPDIPNLFALGLPRDDSELKNEVRRVVTDVLQNRCD